MGSGVPRPVRGSLPRWLAAGLLATSTATAAPCGPPEATGARISDRGRATAPSARSAPRCGEGVADAEVVRRADVWIARRDGGVVYVGGDMLTALRAAVRVPAGVSRHRVVVRGLGTMPAGRSLHLPRHTVLEVCGPIGARGSGGPGR